MLSTTDNLRCPTAWSSNFHHALVAQRVFGSTGTDCLRIWFERQIDCISDPDFPLLFGQKHILLDVPPKALNHRVIERDGIRVLGGIRFFGGDTSRPFVELVAWTDLISAASTPNWPLLKHVVIEEWKEFRPFALRVFQPTEVALPEGAEIDLSVHAAPYRAMSRLPNKCEGLVKLEPLSDVEYAHRMVRQRYAQLSFEEPDLAARICPALQAELKESAAQGRLFAICSYGRTIGVLSTIKGHVEWLEGDVVLEEVVERDHAGRGVATAAQHALARMNASNAGTLLLGTIDQKNLASSKTAQRAGRPAVMRYAFVPLHNS